MLIAVNDITIRAGEQHFFEHTCWTIEKEQHWAISGETGAGKSMLARAISRQLPLVEGRILYYFDGEAGRTFFHTNEILTFSAETHQAFLKQFAGYYQARWQSFEGEEAPNVASLLGMDGAGNPADGKREQIMDLLGLGGLLERKAHLLSNGESRKVLIARLLLRSPKLLILDDPFVGLDAASRARLRASVEGLLRGQDPQILLISSRLEDIPRGISHLLVVKHQRVAYQGEREKVMHEVEAADPRLAVEHEPDAELARGAFGAMVEQYAAALRAGSTQENLALIEMKNIQITYVDVQVLKNITWTVRQGERWALLGPNGAGKSTLLSLILADNPQAYTNELRLFGKQRGTGESIWQIKRKIGWVSPELQAFYEPTTSCLDVACSGFFDSVGLYRQPARAQVDTAAGWLRALGMEEQAHQPFAICSAGQQRLTLLARALVKFPPLLVFDEPCQGLDDAHRRFFVSLVEQLCANAPVTLIYVSHYADEMPATMTHQLRLDHGGIQSSGRIGEE